jgi:colicin import membrane protein
MPENDVEGAVADQLRVALMAAGRIGEQVARLRENQLRHQEASAAHEQRELQNRFNAERLAARAQLEVVKRGEWWDNARPEDIGEAWQLAAAWREQDVEIRHAAEIIHRELGTRWGIDPNNTGATNDQVRAALQNVVAAYDAAAIERDEARRLERDAAALLLEADAREQNRDQVRPEDLEADVAAEDSLRDRAAATTADARSHHGAADKYERIADTEAREAKIVADRGQALPASQATAASGKQSRPRRRAAAAPAQERGLSR